MVDGQVPGKGERKDFFISYTGKDSQWAQWIAFELEAAHYTTIIQAWDIRPGSNFVAKMDEAARRTERTMLVLSEAYLTSDFAFSEWAAAFRDDPRGKQGKVLPVRIQHCRIEGLLGPIGYIDLVDLDEQRAREKLLAGVKRERAKPASVAFPTAPAPSGPLVDRPVFPGSLPPVWNIPYPQNPLFTGREELLTQLATTLHTGQPTALSQPQAISGLGGIGKTQLALEYAYRYRRDYQAILWAQADTRENLTSSYLAIAVLLNLPEKSEQESAHIITAVKVWLQRNTHWLLILDNADDLALARDFLPPSVSGHVLLTTRAQATGRLAHRLEVDILPTEQGVLFLLHRANLLHPNASFEQAPKEEQDVARAVYEELGGLPLALDQAGAYIEATQCSLWEYLHLYQEHQTELLKERGGLVPDHPDSVAITWSLSFAKVEQANPAAADLLRLCAFLQPDAIPDEILIEGAEHLSPQLQAIMSNRLAFNQSIHALLAYSLIRRNSKEHLLSVHRLVQVVLRDEMDEQTRRRCAEQVVRAVHACFPVAAYETWTQCERYLPQGQICAKWIKEMNIVFPEAVQLLDRIGTYLLERVRPTEAELFLLDALPIIAQVPELGFYATAHILDRLAYSNELQGDYAQAELLYAQALTINKNNRGPKDLSTAYSLNNLAVLCSKQRKYEQALALYLQVLEIFEQQLDTQHPDAVITLHNIVMLLFHTTQGNNEIIGQLETMLEHALALLKETRGLVHPNTASILNDLGVLYYFHKKYKQAKPLLKQALAIREQLLGPEHPDIAQSLNNLAELYHSQKKYQDAEPLLERALTIREHKQGPEHLDTAQSLRNLAELYDTQGDLGKAKPLYLRALTIREQQLGLDHPDTRSVARSYLSLLQTIGHEEEVAQLELRYPTLLLQ